MAKKQQYIYNEHDRSQVHAELQNRKKRKRKKLRRRILFVLVLLLVVAYFVTDISKVKSIEVHGNDRITTEVIKETTGVKEHSSFYLFQSTKTMENKINDIPGIKDVNVSKDILGNIDITIKETSIIAYSKIGETTYIVDEVGDSFANTSTDTEIKLTGCPQIFSVDEELLKSFAKEYAKIPSQVRNQISEIHYSPKNADATRCQFNMDDGKMLYLRIEDMAEQLSGDKYAIAINQYPDKKYYDFVGNKVYADDNPYE
ncbi:MAG: cell division protein FtsQ/DivIB [Coprobacillaceae bacterium]